MVKLFSGNFKFGNFILNTFIITLFTSIIMIIIKKYMTNKEFIHKLVIEYEKYINNKDSNVDNNFNEVNNEEKCKNPEESHEINNKTTIYAKKMKIKILIYGIIGILFLIFNCILVTSFCGIYSNSDDELFLNTFVSIIISTIVRILFFLIGVILRYYSFKNNSETMYNISRLFNPLNLSLEELENMKFSIKCSGCKCKKRPKTENIYDRPPDS